MYGNGYYLLWKTFEESIRVIESISIINEKKYIITINIQHFSVIAVSKQQEIFVFETARIVLMGMS